MTEKYKRGVGEAGRAAVASEQVGSADEASRSQDISYFHFLCVCVQAYCVRVVQHYAWRLEDVLGVGPPLPAHLR